MLLDDGQNEEEPVILGSDSQPFRKPRNQKIRVEDLPPQPRIEIGPTQIRIGTSDDDSNVMIDFGTATKFIALTPSQAMDLAHVLEQVATSIL